MNLNDLGSSSYWHGLSEDGAPVPFTFVLPTGRATESITPHLALSTDGLLLPELAIAIDKLARRASRPGVEVRTILDLDFYEEHVTDPERNENLCILGSADVNLAAALLLDASKSYETWRAGFTKPYEQPSLLGVRGTRYMFTTCPNTGLLAMYKNIWARRPRIALLCAGLFAVGTIAAVQLLLDYVGVNGDGNNRYNPELPMKIVDGVPRTYHKISLKPLTECFPPMDVVNISQLNIRE